MPAFVAVTAVAGWFGIGLQGYISITNSLASGAGLMAGVIEFVSFFTVLANVLVASVLTAVLLRPRSVWGEFLSRPAVQAAAAAYIIVVGAAYYLLLWKVRHPEGLDLVSDVILHCFVPVFYIAYWLAFVPKGSLKWKDPATWLIFPAVYLVYVLFRGAMSGLYPYPFTHVDALGYPRVLVNMAILLAAGWCTGVLLVAIDHWVVRSSPADRHRSIQVGSRRLQ